MVSLKPFIIAAAIVAIAAGTSSQPSPPFNVIGYYADWTADRYPLADIPADKLTHVNYAFGKIGPDNRLTWNAAVAVDQVYPGDCGEPGCRHGLFNQITNVKKKHPQLKFILSVGGWTDSAPFYEMAASDAARQTFVDSCASFLSKLPAVRRHRHRLGAPGGRRTAARAAARRPQLRAAPGGAPPRDRSVQAADGRSRALDRGPSNRSSTRHGGVARLGQRDDLRLPYRRNPRRLQLAALQPRRSVEPTPQPARFHPGDPGQGRSAQQARRRRAVLRARVEAEWTPRPWAPPAPARCRSAVSGRSPKRS